MYDVAVIGAGPVGSQAAYKLASLGYQVVVLEKNTHLRGKNCCTGIIGQECVDSFSIADNVILRRVNSASLFPPLGNMLGLWREEPQACILDRAAFDVFLAGRAQDAGAEYALNCAVDNVAVSDDRVSIEVMGGSVEARAVIIASGFTSGLGERLGLGRADDFVAGAQAEVATSGVDEVEVYFGSKVAPGFFAWLVPTSKGMARVGLLSRSNPGQHLKKLMASLKYQGKITSVEAEVSHGAIPLKPLARTCGERLLVVGDAAGQVKPTTGGGIYYGLLCADIAADTLSQALHEGDVSAQKMAQYEQRWRKKLKRELRIGYWARKLFERMSDAQIDRLFDIIKSSGIDKELLQAKDLSFDWHGKSVVRLLGFRMIASIAGVVKFPFRSGRV